MIPFFIIFIIVCEMLYCGISKVFNIIINLPFTL